MEKKLNQINNSNQSSNQSNDQFNDQPNIAPVTQICINAQQAAQNLRLISANKRKEALYKLADNLIKFQNEIISVNNQDVQKAKEQGLSSAMIDRLTLTPNGIVQMAQSVKDVANQDEVVWQTVQEITRPNGIVVKKQRVPLGVIAMVFESRPNVVIDCSALAIKSANAMILKGGKEAHYSNTQLAQIIEKSFEDLLPSNTVQVLASYDRTAVELLLKMHEYIDLMIPRGGESLIKYVHQNATMPVIAHYKGLCHMYVHEDATLEWAHSICLNAKVQRPGVCNALETLLVHQNIASSLLNDLIPGYQQAGVEIRGCDQTYNFPDINSTSSLDWDTEYLDLILSIKIVQNLDQAIEHIKNHGSNHTEGICSSSSEAIETFKNAIDASCVMVNASTRFNDGGQLGLGAELGISTSKIHAYGPMGVEQMTTMRFIVEGKGHIRT